MATTQLIMRCLSEHGPATREDIAWRIERSTSWTRLALELLVEEGKIEYTTIEGGRGRRPRLYSISSAPATPTPTTKTAG